MKRLIFIIIFVCATFTASMAQDATILKNGSSISIKTPIRTDDIQLESKEGVRVTPFLVSGNHSQDFPSIEFMGKVRYIVWLRAGGSNIPGHEKYFLDSEKPSPFIYEDSLAWQDWMRSSDLGLRYETFGCCGEVSEEKSEIIGHFLDYASFRPEVVYVTPEVEKVKARSISGKAYVDFPVNQTIVYPSFRNNQVELDKITATIDSVKNDSDITVKIVSLKGYASPEGDYANNERLAKGRAQAIGEYVMNLLPSISDVLTHSYEAEDWEGYTKYVELSALTNRDAILAVMAEDIDVDAKDRQIKTKWPEDYKIIYENCFPSLRRTDYNIEYVIRGFSEIPDILRAYRESPSKLSLSELFALSAEYPEGSKEFNEVIMAALGVYPDNEIANLNAASAAIEAGNLTMAERFLKKAGDSAETVYLRGALEYIKGNWEDALPILAEASRMGIPQATKFLSILK